MFLAQLGQALRDRRGGRATRASDPAAARRAGAAERYVSPYHFAYVYTGLGEHDAAIDWLERGLRAAGGSIYGIKGSFLFEPPAHPRFQALLRKMNL